MEEQKVKKPFYKKWWFWVICVFVLLGAIGSNGDNKTNTTASNNPAKAVSTQTETAKTESKPAATEKPKVEAIKVDSVKLYKDYEANEVAADQQYKGKLLEVSGIVDTIGKDILDKPYVALKADEVIGSVQCFFSTKDLEELATVKKGSPIKIQGDCDGKMMNILIKDSKIVK